MTLAQFRAATDPGATATPAPGAQRNIDIFALAQRGKQG
jgi:hypothetical protein